MRIKKTIAEIKIGKCGIHLLSAAKVDYKMLLEFFISLYNRQHFAVQK